MSPWKKRSYGDAVVVVAGSVDVVGGGVVVVGATVDIVEATDVAISAVELVPSVSALPEHAETDTTAKSVPAISFVRCLITVYP